MRIAYPTVYHAPPWNKAEKGLGFSDIRLSNPINQAMQAPKPNFDAARQVERVKPGTVLCQRTHASFRHLFDYEFTYEINSLP